MRGVFYCPRYSKLIDEFEAPSPDKVAKILARKFSWSIATCGDTALNQLGLSTQVPANKPKDPNESEKTKKGRGSPKGSKNETKS